MSVDVTKLPSGLTVITDTMPHLETAALGVWTGLVLLFLFVPIAIIVVYAFNSSNIQSWPIAGWTTHWFGEAWRDA